MTRGVVALPQPPQALLPADIPHFEIHVWQVYRGDVLADGGHGFSGGGGVGGEVVGFDLREEGGFAGVVEAEEEDGEFWEGEGRLVGLGDGGAEG